MHGHNAAFVGDPMGYLNATVVDNISFFRQDPGAGAAVAVLDAAKSGGFDLDFAGLLPERRSVLRVSPAPLMGDAPIQAYWCPFVSGGGLPGWVDLPTLNPPWRFMFTASMQGCALVVTPSPVANHIRVYHHQHPTDGPSQSVWNALNGVGQQVSSILAYDDYGVAGVAGPQVANALNFLYYRNGRWNFVTQAHVFVQTAMTLGVRRRAGHGNNGVSIASVD